MSSQQQHCRSRNDAIQSSCPVFVHIGFGKTGSLTLQKNLFANLRGYEYRGKPKRDVDTTRLIRTITECDELVFAATWNAFRKDVLLPLLTAGRPVIISAESLCTGSSTSSRVSRATIAHRIRAAFPQAQILVVLRKQEDILKSYFVQLVKSGVRKDTQFGEWLTQEKARVGYGSILELFQYDSILELYAELFGLSRVHVLLYEELRDDERSFLARVAAIIGIKSQLAVQLAGGKRENTRPSAYRLRWMSVVRRAPILSQVSTRLPVGVTNWARALLQRAKSPALTYGPGWEEFLIGFYSESNARVEAKFGLALSAYSYSLPGARPEVPIHNLAGTR